VIKAKKSLGQNFLTDKNIIDKIVNTVPIKDKIILEVGPGTGNLTSYILKKKPKKTYLIEKDNELILSLKKNFQNKVEIINNDILKINEKKISKEILTVFGNLPYNISTEILCKWVVGLNNKDFWFDNLVLMFQKEVAERIIAKYNSSNYGRLTVLANWKLEIKKILDIRPECFVPMPKVDSSLLIFKPKKNFYPLKDPKNIEMITKIFFNHRRKMLKKPFNQVFKGNKDIEKKLNLDLSLRPQNLDLNTYYTLVSEYEKLRG
tara:strand:+ start:111 stop:899 length:789 start_codon:yes stop_codon:yes gene_type:complete